MHFYLLESKIHHRRISKEHIYFLQTEQYLLLQPLLFYDFGAPPPRDDENGRGERGTARPLSWYQSLAILLLEILQMKRIEKYSGGEENPVPIASQELNRKYWNEDCRRRLKKALRNCLLGPLSTLTREKKESFFLTDILGPLVLQYHIEKTGAGLEAGDSRETQKAKMTEMDWRGFDASFIREP